MDMRDDIDELALRIPCHYCHAAVGDVCRTKSGVVATSPHGDRTFALQQAYWRGYETGERDTFAIIADRAARSGLYDTVTSIVGDSIHDGGGPDDPDEPAYAVVLDGGDPDSPHPIVDGGAA